MKDVIRRRGGGEDFKKLKESNDGSKVEAKINLQEFTELVSASDEQYGNMLAALDDWSNWGRTAMGGIRNSYLEFRERNNARHQGRLLSLDLVEKDEADQTVWNAWNLSGSVGELDTFDFVTLAKRNETCDSNLLGTHAGKAEENEDSVEGHMGRMNERRHSESACKGTKTINLGLQKHGTQGND